MATRPGHVAPARLADAGAAGVRAAAAAAHGDGDDDDAAVDGSGRPRLTWDELVEYRCVDGCVRKRWGKVRVTTRAASSLVPPPLSLSHLAASLADVWDGGPITAPAPAKKRARLDPAAAAAAASASAAPPTRKRKSPSPPAHLPTGDAFLLTRVRAVLATADTARTSVRHVRARVVAEGAGAPVPSKRDVRKAVDAVLSDRQSGGGRAGVGVLLGGGGSGGGGTRVAGFRPSMVPLPVGLAASDVDAYVHAATGDGALLTADDELTMPFTGDARDDAIQGTLALADALQREHGATPAAAMAGARAAVAASSAGLSAAWIASFRKGRGTLASWAAQFKPPGVEGGRAGAPPAGTATPTPRRRVVAVPAAAIAVAKRYVPRGTAAFRGTGGQGAVASAAADADASMLEAAFTGLQPAAATVLDRAAGAGVRPGVVCAAAAALKDGG